MEWGELGGACLARLLQGPVSPEQALAARSWAPPPPGLEILPPCSEHLGFRPDLEPPASTKPFPSLTPTCLLAKLGGGAGGDGERVDGLRWGLWGGGGPRAPMVTGQRGAGSIRPTPMTLQADPVLERGG